MAVRSEDATPGAIALLVLGFLGPLVVWLTALQAVYALAAFGCDGDRGRTPLALITAGAVGAVLALAAVARRRHRRSGGGSADDRAPGHRSRFLAAGGLALAVQVVLALAAQALAIAMLRPCP